MNGGLVKVATGLKLVFHALILALVTIAIAVIGVIVLVGAARGRMAPGMVMGGATTFETVLRVLFLLVFLMDLAGRFMCLAVPSNIGTAKGMITTSVILYVVALLIYLGLLLGAVGGALGPTPMMVLALVYVVAGVVSVILFLLFIKNLCQHIRRHDLANRAGTVIWLSAMCVVCYVVAFVIIIAGAAAGGAMGRGGGGAGAMAVGGCIGLILMVAVFVMGLVAFVLYAMLLYGSSAAVRQYARRRSRRRYKEEEDDEDDDDY